MSSSRARLILTLGCLALAMPACFEPPPDPSPARTTAPPGSKMPGAAPPGTAARMVGHFQESLRIKDAVISGELEDLREPASRLRDRTDAYPESWRPFMQANMDFATMAFTAHDIPTAARAAAGLALTCGECHMALGAGPKFAAPGQAPAASPHATREHMLRHQWAADRMWDALVSRSDDDWQAGAAALTDAPLSRDDLMADFELPDDILGLDEHVFELGARARTTRTWSARGAIYGDFLASCANCHQSGC